MIKYNQTSQKKVKAQLPLKIHLSLLLITKTNYKLGHKARAKQKRALEGGKKAAVKRKRLGWPRTEDQRNNTVAGHLHALTQQKEGDRLAFPNSQPSKKRQPRRIIPPLEGARVHHHQQERSTSAVGNGILPHGPKTPLSHQGTLVHPGSTS